MDIHQLHADLARAILAADQQATEDAKAFLDGFIANLPADFKLTPEVELDLEGYITRSTDLIRAGITEAIGIGGVVGSMSDELTKRLAEDAFARTWEDGKNLSSRIWGWRRDAIKGTEDVLQAGIRQQRSVNSIVYDMQRAIEESRDRFAVVANYEAGWVDQLAETGLNLIHNPGANRLWLKRVGETALHIEGLKETGTKWAAERVFREIRRAVKTGNTELVADALNWWLYNQQLYKLKRIVRTEMANACHNAIIASTEADEDIIGYQWRLSSTHHVPDICDYYASIEMGLGKGVWTKDTVPKHKAHPHCMCLIVPRVSPVRDKGAHTYEQFINNLPADKRGKILPQWAQQAISNGTKLADLIRPDGLGLITLQQNPR